MAGAASTGPVVPDRGRLEFDPADLGAVFDAMLDPHVLLEAVRDEQGRVVDFVYVHANAAACAYNRMPPETLVGSRLMDLLPGHQASGLLAAYAAVVDGGPPLALDGLTYAQELLGGSPRRYDIRAVRVGDSDVLSFSWRDVSDRHAVADALAASESRYRLLAENASDVVYLTDHDGIVRWISPTVGRALGWSPEELIGRTLVHLLHPDDAAATRAQRERSYAPGSAPTDWPAPVLVRMRTSAGDYRWMSARVTAVHDETLDRARFVVGLRDVDDLVAARARAEAAVAAERLTALSMDSAVVGMAIASPEGRLLHVNDAMCRMLGHDRAALESMSFRDVTHPDDLQAGIVAVRELAAGIGDSFAQRKRYLTATGDAIWVDLFLAPVRDDQGRLLHFVAQLVDVNAEVLARLALERSEHLLRTAIDGAPHGMAVAGADGTIRRVNPALERLLGLPSAQIVGRQLRDFVPAEDFEPAGTTEVRHEHRLLGPARQPWVEHAAAPMLDADGQSTLVVHQFSDQTETRRYREELAHRASHDDLTGLSNRSALMIRLQRQLQAGDPGAVVEPAPEYLGVLFCDLDNLKGINDTLGHLVGDAALTATADRIRACVRADDVVARVGGDEFVVLIDHARDEQALALVARKVLAATAEPLDIEDQDVVVTLSMGATLAEAGEDPDEVLARADQALYQAKNEGRNRLKTLLRP